MAVTKLDIKNAMLTKARVLGNSKRGFKELCSDLINQHGLKGKAINRICEGTFLSAATIERMSKLTESESGEPYRPSSDTVERILKYFGAEATFDQISIDRKYQNAPKVTE